jgi:hypothetical protein
LENQPDWTLASLLGIVVNNDVADDEVEADDDDTVLDIGCVYVLSLPRTRLAMVVICG